MKNEIAHSSEKSEIPGIPRQAFFTIKEAASLFKVHVRTVERWIEERRLGAIVLPGGRLIRIPHQEILKVCEYHNRL